MAPLDCGSFDPYTLPSFTPAVVSPPVIFENQLPITIHVWHVASPGGRLWQRTAIPTGQRYGINGDTAGLWFATDDADINIQPLTSSSSSSIEACYYVMGTSDVTIIVA